MFFFILLAQVKLLFGALVVLFLWYILKQLFLFVSVKVFDIYFYLGE